MGLDFPNLPYLQDGAFKTTQSAAIMRHIARKRPALELLGRGDQEQGRVDMFFEEVRDLKRIYTVSLPHCVHACSILMILELGECH